LCEFAERFVAEGAGRSSGVNNEQEMSMSSDENRVVVTRRDALAAGATAIGVANLPNQLFAAVPEHVIPDADVALHVNGAMHRLIVDPRATLLDVLRERLSLFGTKKGCDQGQCGACTVHLDGRRVLACLTLARQAEGREVSTIEGVAAPDGALHPVQQAFLDHDALQCGYCTPGQIMSAIACIHEGHIGSNDEIREYMSGNLCRCGAYAGIVAAIKRVAQEVK
jgi:xanthine dehydrogenase YagT iron-sulfur-binding subunit